MAKTAFKTVDDYIGAFPQDVQSVLEKFRTAIRKAVPDAEEVISYQMPTFKSHGSVFILGGWKQHYSLYPWSESLLEAFGEQLEVYDVGEKGTLRFPYDKPVPVRLIAAMSKHRAKENAAVEASKAATTATKRRQPRNRPRRSRWLERQRRRRRNWPEPMRSLLRVVLSLGCASVTAACDSPPPPDNPTASPVATSTSTNTPSPTVPPVTSSPTPARSTTEPTGFPIDPGLRVGLAVIDGDARSIRWGAGPTVEAYTRDDQPSNDPERANTGGWNCRTHQEYENQPAVDWYIPVGTPIRATMDGMASLIVITTSNPFDVYRVSREPYLGNPDRARAPVNAFNGPGGGKGVFVRVEGAEFTTEYAHLDVTRTAAVVPAAAWDSAFPTGSDRFARFGPLRDFQSGTLAARWPVRRGDVIGMSGDSGYSEAPHLHYTVARGSSLRCPTAESGYADAGWLLK